MSFCGNLEQRLSVGRSQQKSVHESSPFSQVHFSYVNMCLFLRVPLLCCFQKETKRKYTFFRGGPLKTRHTPTWVSSHHDFPSQTRKVGQDGGGGLLHPPGSQPRVRAEASELGAGDRRRTFRSRGVGGCAMLIGGTAPRPPKRKGKRGGSYWICL